MSPSSVPQRRFSRWHRTQAQGDADRAVARRPIPHRGWVGAARHSGAVALPYEARLNGLFIGAPMLMTCI
jgi:hypothetical protein